MTITSEVLTMGVTSWNSGQKSWKRSRRVLIRKLRILERDQLVLLQEVKTWQDGIVENMRVLSGVGCDCAILVPNNFGHVSDVVHGNYYSLARVGSLGVGSIHFPHDRGAQDVWSESLSGVRSKLNAWTDTGKIKSIVLGVDLNLTLPMRLESISGNNVYDRRVKHPDRLHDIISFL